MSAVVLAFIAWPIVEIVVAILVAQSIGWIATLLLLLVGSAVGEMVLRRAGRRTGQRLGEALRAGRADEAGLTDDVLMFLGGLLLLIPGFVSDVFGLLLVLPVTRPLARKLVVRRVRSRVVFRSYRGNDDVIEGEVVGERSAEPMTELPPQSPGPRDLGG